MDKLRAGTLAEWVKETTSTRGLHQPSSAADNSMDVDVGESGSDSDEEDIEVEEGSRRVIGQTVTLGCMEMIDGELVIEMVQLEEVDDVFMELKSQDS